VYPVLSGLEKGERVVSRGAFVLDADLQLRGGASMMTRPDDPEREGNGPVALTPADRSTLEPVLHAYLELQAALAADDLPLARKAAGTLGAVASAVQLPAEAAPVWAPLSQTLRTNVSLLARADTIALARGTFAAVSSTIQAVLTRFGNPLEDPIYQAFCPMAFDNRGGTWFQAGTTIDNAYYGATMRTCGELQATIQPGDHLSDEAQERSPG
jgi:Cu(I)/Ag(I) efflux system membrane fusion protein